MNTHILIERFRSVCHHGIDGHSLESGHYSVWTREGSNWLHCSDELIQTKTQANFEQEIGPNMAPYLLFYVPDNQELQLPLTFFDPILNSRKRGHNSADTTSQSKNKRPKR
jgi:hypothetical protein